MNDKYFNCLLVLARLLEESDIDIKEELNELKVCLHMQDKQGIESCLHNCKHTLLEIKKEQYGNSWTRENIDEENLCQAEEILLSCTNVDTVE